ncbi:MAG: hypothetical protein FWF82_04455 [Oscillospiraceae bacterium]|nr:hypothetical protein [Oscillospiraceae bacterium]
MKNRLISSLAVLTLCLTAITGCDPRLPKDDIIAECSSDPLVQGDTAEIEIICPDEKTAVTDWINQKAEIISGDDIVGLDGFTVTGLSPGIAVIRVESTAVCKNWFLWFSDEFVYTVDIEVEVVESVGEQKGVNI